MKRPLRAIIVTAALLSGCGGQKDATDSRNGTDVSNKGIGPIQSIDVSALDSTLAVNGSTLFEAKCVACHKMEERYIGPALLGVTKRREPEWIMNMILNPDVMVREDMTAKSLLEEYLTPMTNQYLTEEQAQAVLAYFLENDKHVDK